MPVSRRSRLPPSIMPKPRRVRKARAVPARARGPRARTANRRRRTGGRAAPLDLFLVLDAVEREHQPVLKIVERVHRFPDGQILGCPVAERVVHLGGQPLHAEREVSRQLSLLGNVQHLELVQEPVDMPNPVPARIAQLALRLPSLALRGDLDLGLLHHTSAAEGTSHASRTTTLRSNTELVKNLNPARRPTPVAPQCPTRVSGVSEWVCRLPAAPP